jgi:hypothetical protein
VQQFREALIREQPREGPPLRLVGRAGQARRVGAKEGVVVAGLLQTLDAAAGEARRAVVAACRGSHGLLSPLPPPLDCVVRWAGALNRSSVRRGAVSAEAGLERA